MVAASNAAGLGSIRYSGSEAAFSDTIFWQASRWETESALDLRTESVLSGLGSNLVVIWGAWEVVAFSFALSFWLS
ncbi:hypothetical protein FVEN_g13013 [Fusarium venenatum]|nr:hypothetical protein FVEN_g13013 [Fusarium venenatum]